jgi:hypothetical protein
MPRTRTRIAPETPFAMNVSQIYDGDDEPVEMKIDLDKETATEAALLPGYAALFPYKLIVSVDLA